MCYKKFVFDGYTVELEEPTLHVDNEARKRSGLLSHALVELKPGTVMAFNSNCAAELMNGQSPFGWIEYRISEDGGKTYGEPVDIPYTKNAIHDGIYSISIEKAVVCNDGSIVAFCLRNSITMGAPWDAPAVIRSTDGGKTWTEPTEIIGRPSRIFDAVYRNGVIYTLSTSNDHTIGASVDKHRFYLYKSYDNGKTFDVTYDETHWVHIMPIGRGYGSIVFDGNANLHAYAYVATDKTVIEHAVSFDYDSDLENNVAVQRSWRIADRCYVDLGAENPQVSYMDGIFLMHGISADGNSLVLYTSKDGYKWSAGQIIATKESGGFSQYASNAIVLSDDDGKFLLVQYSEIYDGGKTNVKHVRIRIRKGE